MKVGRGLAACRSSSVEDVGMPYRSVKPRVPYLLCEMTNGEVVLALYFVVKVTTLMMHD